MHKSISRTNTALKGHIRGCSLCLTPFLNESTQKAPARLGFPGALPQRRVVWMWFGAFPGAFGLGRASPGEENGNPLQYSCLENPMDGGAW